MSRPTILIGIGSGGLRSIESAWKLSQEISNPTNRPNVQYIYLETDGANEPLSSEIVKSPLTLNNIATTKHAIEQDINSTSQWISGQSFPNNVFSGAGGSPVLGRVTLWDANNRQTFVQNLHAAQQRLANVTLEKPMVYVVGSFGGGTGSGTFLDIAYIIRDTLANQVELQGLFMIPNLGLADQVVYSNSICCLKELDYYNDENHQFPFKWAANPPKGFERENTPYDLIQIISASYGTSAIGVGATAAALPPVTYSQLHEEAGIFLYLNSLGMYDTRRSSLVDATGNVIISKYTTFGLSAIHYPESDIKEIESNILAESMLERIIDDTQYYDNNYLQYRNISQSINSIRNGVKNTFSSRFVKIIETWCGQISIAENGQNVSWETHLQSLAEELSSSNYGYKEKKIKLYKLFKVGGEYYQQLKNLCQVNAVDQVINLIISEVKETLNSFHNLNIAEYTLDEIEDTVNQILSFWKANGYTAIPQDWDQILKSEIETEVLPMPLVYKTLLEKQKVYFDRLKFILLYGLAMHVFSDNLSKIHKALKGDTDAAGNRIQVCISSTGEIMPAKWRFAELSKIVENVAKGADARYSSCSQVVAALKKKLSKEYNGNIWYIYPQGDLATTLNTVDDKFRTQYGQERSINDVTNNDDLYTFLSSIVKNNLQDEVAAERDLYRKVVSAYMGKVNLGEFSVSSALNDNNYDDKVKLVANRSLIPHVPTNPTGRNATFIEHKNIPHILGGYDGAAGDVLSNISQRLTGLGIHTYAINNVEREKFSHVGLNNWLIFYQEFGRMSDQKPFNIVDDLADFNDYVTCYVSDSNSSNDSAEIYHGKRMPYVSYKECHELSKEYINKAMSKTNGKEFEAAEKCYRYATYWDMSNPTSPAKLVEVRAMISNETADEKFDRYFNIASKYMEEQDYMTAREYYMRADKVQHGDPNVIAQINHIDQIYGQVTTLLAEGDNACTEANLVYDDVILRGQIMRKPDCIQMYTDILNIYRQAEGLSKYDTDVKRKISNIERRIRILNN